MYKFHSGFSLIELLVSIAIIAVVVTLATVYLLPARTKARDTKRQADIAQIGRFLTTACYLPNQGAGDYDLADLEAELKSKYPQYSSFIVKLPQDPKTGTDTQTNYRYVVSVDGARCALYANLENSDAAVTLSAITTPTPGGGTGVLATPAAGWNGTNKYFQYSN